MTEQNPPGSNGQTPRPAGRRHKSFSTSGRERPPVSFDIDGTEFTCEAMVPGSVLLEHVRALTSPEEATAVGELLVMWQDVFDTETPIYQRDQAGEVVYDDEEQPIVLAESEYHRFREYIDDPANEVDIQDLGEMLYWVLEQLAGRPTQGSQPSQSGQSASGPTSASDSPEQAATPTPSTSRR